MQDTLTITNLCFIKSYVCFIYAQGKKLENKNLEDMVCCECVSLDKECTDSEGNKHKVRKQVDNLNHFYITFEFTLPWHERDLKDHLSKKATSSIQCTRLTNLCPTIKLTSLFLYQVNSIWSEGLCDELECRLTNDLQLEIIRTKITCPACRADEVAVEVRFR